MYKDFDHAWPLRQAFLGHLHWPNARLMNYVATIVVVLLLVTTAIRW